MVTWIVRGTLVLMWTSNDTLKVAMVRVGAATNYSRKGLRKRALVMAAVHGCYRTMEAIVALDFPVQKFNDRSFHPAALQLSGDRQVQGSSVCTDRLMR